MPNINNKQWMKKFGEDRGYGADESLTMSDTGDYSTTATSRSGGMAAGLGAQTRSMSTRSGGRQPVRRPSPPRVPPPPRRK